MRSGDSQLVYDKLGEFHFFIEQPPLRALQSKIEVGADGAELTPLSRWIVDFHVKPRMRPVGDVRDASVIVSLADASFVGLWKIGVDSHPRSS